MIYERAGVMPFCSRKFPDSVKNAFSFENIICRLLAAWCVFSAVSLFGKEKFTDLSFMQETSLLLLSAVILLLFVILSAVRVFTRSFESDSWFLLIPACVCVFHWLTDYSDSRNSFLFVLAVSTAFSLFVLYFIKRNSSFFDSVKIGSRSMWSAAVVFAVICGFIISLFSCLRYLTFTSPNFDFGLFVNMFHNMKETGLPLCTSERDVLMSHFAVHISPIYYLILPFYAIFPSPLTLQITQAVLIASCVFPVVLLCRHFGISEKMTVAAAFITSLYPALLNGCMYDLHENCFLAPLLLWVFWFFESRRYPLMYVFCALTLGVKEDAAVYLVIFALYLILSRRKPMHGVIIASVSVLYFITAINILEAYAAHYAELYAASSPNPGINGPMVNRFDNLIADNGGLGGAVKTALVNPGFLLTQLFTTADDSFNKIVYFFQLFLPLGFLPFFSLKPSRWILLTPVLMNLLTYYKYQYDILYQYHFGISAFLIYAALLNLSEIRFSQKKYIVSLAAAVCCCFCIITIFPKTNYYIEKWESGAETYRKMEEILDSIPSDASVNASSSLLAHIADRDEIYAVNYHGDEGDVDYVVLDIRSEIDEDTVSAYTDQGYSVLETHHDLIMILKKAE